MGEFDFTYSVPANFNKRVVQFLQQFGKAHVAQAFQRCEYEYEDLGLAYYAGMKGDNWNKNALDFTFEGAESDIALLLLWSSFFVTLVAKKIVLINLCCRPCFIWGSITIITVWTNMIIINVCKFFYLLIECFLCCKLIQICAFILQGIEVTLHRCIVVRISCFAHALCHIYRFAEFGKCFGRIL